MDAGSQGGAKSAINVTPLVDVVLVLLIIFMAVTPMLERGKTVALPKAAHTEQENEASDALVLSVTADRSTWIENQRVERADLVERLERELRTTPGRRVLLKADESLDVRDIRPLLVHLRAAGASGVALAVREASGLR